MQELLEREARRVQLKLIMEKEMQEYYQDKKHREYTLKVDKNAAANKYVESIIDRNSFLSRKMEL